MNKNLLKSFGIALIALALVISSAFATYRYVMDNMQISADDEHAYVTVFGQTDKCTYQYIPFYDFQ